MLLVSGVVKIGHVATILVILGPMAAFFGPMQTFSAILRSVTIIFGPEVILSAILGSVTTLFGPGVTLSATLRSLGPFQPSTGPSSDLLGHPWVCVDLLFVRFDLLQAPGDLLGHPRVRPLIAVPLFCCRPLVLRPCNGHLVS